MAHKQPTRAAETHTAGGTVVTQSSLDRAMTTLPPTTMAMTTVHCRIPSIARAISTATYQAASDHLPVRTTLRARAAPPPMQRPMPTWVTRHPLFPEAVSRRLEKLRLDELTTSDALRQTRQAIRSAGAEIRNRALNRQPTRFHEVRQVALQAVRALYRRDARGLQREAARWKPLRDVVSFAGDAYEVTDSEALYNLLGRAATNPDSFFADEVSTTPQCTRTGGSRRGRPGNLDRWMKMWAPHLQRQWLAKILTDDDAGPPRDEPRDGAERDDNRAEQTQADQV